ncbi:MAG: hypothetical protein ACE5JL_00785 [Dehalococcoidia bacterium]
MSNVSVLSHEYKRSSELSQSINRALITIKKARLRLPGAETLPADEIDNAGRCLAEILTALVSLLGPARGEELQGSVFSRLPGDLIARLRQNHSGDLAYYLDDLKGAATRLYRGLATLTEADLTLLDQLAAATDAETSNVFRRLMRK